jgi:copper chaperone
MFSIRVLSVLAVLALVGTGCSEMKKKAAAAKAKAAKAAKAEASKTAKETTGVDPKKAKAAVAAAKKGNVSKTAKAVTAAMPAGYKSVLLKVEGMTCAGCPPKVDAILAGVTGLKNNGVSWEDGSAKIAFDPAATDAKKIAALITDGTKFTASVPE